MKVYSANWSLLTASFSPPSPYRLVTFPSNWCLSSTLLAGAALRSIRDLTTAPLVWRGRIWPKFNKGSGVFKSRRYVTSRQTVKLLCSVRKCDKLAVILRRFHWQRTHSDVIMCKMLSAASPSAPLTHFRLGLCVDEQHNCLCLCGS